MKNTAIRFGIIWILSFLLAITVFQRELNTNGDNAAFLIYGKAIAEGKGFRMIAYPDAPKSEQFPILFPLIISLFIKLFGFNILMLKLSMTAVFATTIAVFDKIISSLLPGKVSTALLLLTASNYWMLDNASIHMSEMTYILFSLIGFLSVLYYEKNNKEKFLYLAAILFAALPFIRTAGLSAVAASLVYFYMTKKRNCFYILIVSFAAFWILNRLSMESATSYFSTLLLKNPYRPAEGSLTATGFISRIIDNISFYSTQTLRMTLLAFMSENPTATSSNGGTIAGSVLFLTLLSFYPINKLRTSPFESLIRIYLVIYLGILAAWPQVWAGSRFITPIIPLLLYISFRNSHYLINRFVQEGMQKKAMNFLLVISIMWSIFNYASIREKVNTPVGDDWRDYYKVAEWAKENLPDTSVVCARSPYLFYLKSGRYTRPVPTTNIKEDILQIFDSLNIDYVVIDKFKWSGITQAYISPLINTYPELFKPVFSTPEATLFIYSRQKPG